MNKELLKTAGFSSEVAMVEQGLCPFCGEVIDESKFRDELSRKEFTISGLCQKCQDDVFNCSMED
jgi:transcription initiation factor IIE alpha subunit